MTELVIDTNIVFSSLIPKESKIREILFDKQYRFFSPNFLLTEIFIHKEKLLRISHLSSDNIYSFFNDIIENISFVPLDMISKFSRKEAYELCKEVDMKDIPFIALSLELNIPLWTGDKKIDTFTTRKEF